MTTNVFFIRDFFVIMKTQLFNVLIRKLSESAVHFVKRHYCRQFVNFKWRLMSFKLKLFFRSWILRYEKLLKYRIDSFVRKTIKKKMNENDLYFRKNITKTQNNIVIWKNKIFVCMKIIDIYNQMFFFTLLKFSELCQKNFEQKQNKFFSHWNRFREAVS